MNNAQNEVTLLRGLCFFVTMGPRDEGTLCGINLFYADGATPPFMSLW